MTVVRTRSHKLILGENSSYHQGFLVVNSIMTMSEGLPQTFLQNGVCIRSVQALLSIYLLLAICSFAFSCSMINKLTYLELELKLQ